MIKNLLLSFFMSILIFTNAYADAIQHQQVKGKELVYLAKDLYDKTYIDTNFYFKSFIDDNFYTKSFIDANYYTKSFIDANYYTKSFIDANYYTSSLIHEKFYTKTYINTNFYTKSYIDKNFYTMSFIDANFYTKTHINTNYYTQAEVDELLKKIKPGSSVITNRYPLFCIELNTDVQNFVVSKSNGVITDISIKDDDSSSMSDWTTFELKGSTNNFLNASSSAILNITNNEGVTIRTIRYDLPGLAESEKLLYWACSEFSTEPYESSDTMRKYVTESRGGKYQSGHDPRTWYFFNSITQLTNRHPNRVMVLLDPTTFKHVPDNAWCHEHNEDLVWSYKRLREGEQEKDDNGNVVWRPIQPIKWYSQMPSWAYTNGEVRVISEEEYLKYK